MKKLLLIDGMAAVYRAYFALNHAPRINSKGFNTSCALGFTTSLYDLLRSQRPTHVGVAFDLSEPTFRHEMYAEYKAHRDPMPEEIESNLPWIHRLIEAFRIPMLTCRGFEADDVIGTLGHAAEEAGFDQVLMATPDKDFAQLVTSCISIYRFGRGKTPDAILGPAEVCAKFGVQYPTQVIDLLGLWGDAIDNIPGIRGVGEKTAQKLISQFGSIEQMVAHADEIGNARLRALVQEHAEDALFSKQLATIRLDAPLAFDEDALRLQEPDVDALREICNELEFRQFMMRLQRDLHLPSGPQALPPTQPVATPNAAPTLFDAAPAMPDNSHNIQQETLSSEVLQSLVGKDVAVLFDGPTVLVSTDADTVWSTTVAQLDIARFSALMGDTNTVKLCFDLKTLRYLLDELQVSVKGRWIDLQMGHYLIDAEMRHDLDSVCQSLLGFAPADAVGRVGALWQLYPLVASRMREAGLCDLYSRVELPLVEVLMDMERAGVRIDTEALRSYSAGLSTERDAIEEKIYEMAGVRFNVNSSRQLGEVLYEQLKVTDKPPRTATKQYSTAEDVLQRLADSHPVIQLVLEYRSINKLVNTYLDTFPRLISPSDHRLHTVFNQTATATGRLSSSNPNLQNIPIRTERGREIRRAFVPADDDHLLLAADYSQIELRIIASLSHDEHLLGAFAQGHDIHAATAARIYHKPMDEVSRDERRNAKSVNFGIVYGISAFGLSQQLSIPRKEAAALIDEYFAQYPAIREFIEQCKSFAREHGYARTLMGRRRYLPDIGSRNAAARSFAERNAVNMPIQGTSADMIKLAMVRIHDEIRQRHLRSRMLIQVHDELLFDLYRPEETEMRQLVERHMQQALPLEGVAIEVGVGVGENWLEAH